MSLFSTGIRPSIDEWLLNKSKETRDYGQYWSASSAGYCQRKVIFERLGVPHVEKEDDARKQRVFTAGHLFHDWIQGITKQAGLSIASEVELQDEDLMIRGHFDDLVLVPNIITEEVVRENLKDFDVSDIEITPKQRLILYDYKTVNSQSFKYKNDLSYYHKMQLGTYMYMLRKVSDNVEAVGGKLLPLGEQLKDLTEARTLLISKDDLRMKEQQLLWSPELESDVLSYWKALNAYWKNKKLPKCTCADHEGGFLAKEKWNPYFYRGEPCSLMWYTEWKMEKAKEVKV